MAHIHTDPGQHDHTASGFIIRTDLNGGPKLVLHRHKKLGIYLQFGGHIELNETPWQAIAHEIREESGYDLSQLKVLQPAARVTALRGEQIILHPQPIVYDTHAFNDQHAHTDVVFGFITDQAPDHSLSAGESSDIRCVNRQELLSMPDIELPPAIKDIGIFIFDECLPRWEQVDSSLFAR